MKILQNIVFSIILLFSVSNNAQSQNVADSLLIRLSEKMPDTSRVLLLEQTAKKIMYSKPDEAMKYAKEGFDLAVKRDFLKGKSRCMNRIGAIQSFLGNHEKALETLLGAIKTSESIGDDEGVAKANINLGVLYGEQNDSKKAIVCYRISKDISEKINNKDLLQLSLLNIGAEYSFLKKYDSAQLYTLEAYQMAVKLKSSDINILLMNLGNINKRKKKYAIALDYYRKSVAASGKVHSDRFLAQTFYMMAELFRDTNRPDSSLLYGKKSLQMGRESNNLDYIIKSGKLLSKIYETTNPSLSLEYYKTAMAANDSLFNQEKESQIQKLTFQEKILREELDFAKKEFKSRQNIGILAGILAIFLLLSVGLMLLNRQKSKANAVLLKQKQEIHTQKIDLQESLEKLKATQNQLIHKEKLASLGELTAGIAHEIQNPLNFVTNFSELNTELSEELKVEIDKSEIANKGIIDEILNDLIDNQKKIYTHGKRASDIVINMLQHSRGNTEEATLININKLADDYLRLSYHGMRAKNKNFNADFELELDAKLPEIKAVGNDIGRVILNLINNAFYATNLRKNLTKETGEAYSPKVTVTTNWKPNEKESNKGVVEVKIKDNGTGISKAIKEKIFQPFFTTKPPGEGTGLGLSLSHEIITKGHNGNLTVESEEGKGTTFVIQLTV